VLHALCGYIVAAAGDWPELTGELNTRTTGGLQPMTAIL